MDARIILIYLWVCLNQYWFEHEKINSIQCISKHPCIILFITCFDSIKWSIWIFVLCTLLCHQEWKSPTSYMSPARAESLAIKRTYPVCLHHCCFWIPSAGYPPCNPWIEPFWSRWKEKNCIWKQKHNTTYIIITQMQWNTRLCHMLNTSIPFEREHPCSLNWPMDLYPINNVVEQVEGYVLWIIWISNIFLINMFFCAIRCIVLTMQYNYVLYKFWPVGASFNN